jgi:isoamylase
MSSAIEPQSLSCEPKNKATTSPDTGESAPLEATPCRGGVNFSIFSRHASRVELLLFDQDDDAKPARLIPFDPFLNGTYFYWHVFVPRLIMGQIYAYRIGGPFDPVNGLRFDSEKVLLDSYGKGVTVPKGYSREAAASVGDNTAGAMKSLLVDPSLYDWEGDAPLRQPSSRTIVYGNACPRFYPSSELQYC